VDDPLVRFAGLYDQFYRNVTRYALQHAERDSPAGWPSQRGRVVSLARSPIASQNRRIPVTGT
jgi:hypothetical protein